MTELINHRKRKLPSWTSEPAGTSIDAQSYHNQKSEQEPAAVDKEEVDDYLTMTFDEKPAYKPRKMDGIRQDTARSLSKLPSKGMKMLERMGYSAGNSLGADGIEGIREPIAAPEEPVARSGLGLDSQRKREIQEKAELAEQQIEQEQTNYRDTVRTEAEQKLMENRIYSAQKICETLNMQTLEAVAIERGDKAPIPDTFQDTKQVNVLWRSRAVYRKQQERERALRSQMLDSATSFSTRRFNDDSPKLSMSEAAIQLRKTVYEEDGEDDESDEELKEFDELDSQERLDRIISYLRDKYYYCFWCGCKYRDVEDLKECPGLTEEAHE